MIRASLEDVVIEPQRQALIPGLPGGAPRGDGGGRARLLDLRRRSHDVRLGARGSDAPAVRDAMQREFARHIDSTRRMDRAQSSRRARECLRERAAGSAAAVPEHPRGAGPASMSFSQALLQGLAPDGGLYVPSDWPRLDARRLRRRDSSWRPWARGCWRRSSAATRSRRSCRQIAAEAFNFPAPLVPLRRRRASGGARAVSRPDRGVQGFRRALSGRLLRAPARAGSRGRSPSWWPPRATPAAPWPRPSMAGRGMRGRACCFPKAWCPRPRSGSSPAGATMCKSFAVRGTFRRLPAPGEAGLSRRPSCGQQTQLSSANSINLGRLLPQSGVLRRQPVSRCCAEVRRAGVLRHSQRQPRQCGWRASGRGKLGLPIARRSCWRTMPIAPCRISWHGGEWRPRASIATLASAMDVGNPSNMERLRALFPEVRAPARGRERGHGRDEQPFARASAPGSSELRADLVPAHGDCGGSLWQRLGAGSSATADAGCWWRRRIRRNSPEIVEPLIGRPVPVPETPGRSCSRGRRRVRKLTQTLTRCVPRCVSGEQADVEELEKAAAYRLGADCGCRRARLRRRPGSGAGTASTGRARRCARR